MEHDHGRSFAARFLARAPTLRERVASSKAYLDWRDSHRSYVDEGAIFYIVGGDMSRDEDEMILEWARRERLVDSEDFDRFRADEPSQFE